MVEMSTTERRRHGILLHQVVDELAAGSGAAAQPLGRRWPNSFACDAFHEAGAVPPKLSPAGKRLRSGNTGVCNTGWEKRARGEQAPRRWRPAVRCRPRSTEWPGDVMKNAEVGRAGGDARVLAKLSAARPRREFKGCGRLAPD